MKRIPGNSKDVLAARSHDEPNGCRIWDGPKKGGERTSGYGQMPYRFGGGGYPHRVSYEQFRGEIPDGMLVCHSCDNPLCINPEHLFLGTPLENTHDMLKKGRHVKASPSKATPEKVSAMRAARLNGESVGKIAAEFAIDLSYCYQIVKQESRILKGENV